MDVRCPQCQTLYELDDDQVGSRSVTLKCSQCQHVFRLGGRSASDSGENQRRWMVRRKREGDILYLNSFDKLHEWIMKRTVRDEDQISRTGDGWTTLKDIGEFQPMFQVVESIAQLEGELEVSGVSSILTRRNDTPTSVAGPKPHRERIRTSIQFGGAGVESTDRKRTEDVTKKVKPTDVMPDEVAEELESHFATQGGDEKFPAPPRVSDRSPSRAPLITADISREQPDPAPLAPSSGVGTWLVVAVIAAIACGAFIWLFQQEDFLNNKPDVVVIGQTQSATNVPKRSEVSPDEELEEAIDAALSAAAQENDAIWTLWHETASKPFYIALDTAYAEADQASAEVEIDQELRNARVALENGRLEQASRGFKKVLAKEPRNTAAVTGLGWALLELGRAKEAAKYFRRSIELDDGYGDAYIGLGSAHRQLGQLQDAYNAYDRYMGRFPKGAKASIASYQMKQLKQQLGN